MCKIRIAFFATPNLESSFPKKNVGGIQYRNREKNYRHSRVTSPSAAIAPSVWHHMEVRGIYAKSVARYIWLRSTSLWLGQPIASRQSVESNFQARLFLWGTNQGWEKERTHRPQKTGSWRIVVVVTQAYITKRVVKQMLCWTWSLPQVRSSIKVFMTDRPCVPRIWCVWSMFELCVCRR